MICRNFDILTIFQSLFSNLCLDLAGLWLKEAEEVGVRGEDIRMFRIGINLEASGKGEEDGFTFKSIQILKEIFFSQVSIISNFSLFVCYYYCFSLKKKLRQQKSCIVNKPRLKIQYISNGFNL